MAGWFTFFTYSPLTRTAAVQEPHPPPSVAPFFGQSRPVPFQAPQTPDVDLIARPVSATPVSQQVPARWRAWFPEGGLRILSP